MSSQEISMVPSQRLTSNLVFPDSSPLPFNCAAPQRRQTGDPGPKTLQLNGFIHDRYFASQAPEFRRTLYGGHGEGSEDDEEEEPEEEEEEDEEDEVDEGDGEVDGLVGVENGNKCNNGNNNNSNGSVHSGADKVENEKLKHHSSFGLSREVMEKDGCKNARASTGENHLHLHQQQQEDGRIGNYQNAVTITEADGDMYYSQYLQAPDGCGAGGQKELAVENGCGFSGRKDSSFSSESGESLRAIFSDPITGALMDDAMILPCGHSFGSGGMEHIIRMKTCYTCSQPISEDSIAPNLSLQAAVQAFRREEELQFYHSNKRRRERYDQEKSNYGDSTLMDPPRGRGVQFPFAVTDRVIIKGNKRTPQRFVGREAIVTTQCLNGWYVVKTLDNAESVKLQYRSLAKVSDDQSSKSTSNKMAPNWL